MKSRNRRTTKAKIVFFVPFIVLLSVVAFQIINYAITPRTGILQVDTQLAVYHGPSVERSLQVTVDGTATNTPAQVSLAAGAHIVAFASMTGYYTPLYKSVAVVAGQTAFVSGLYEPVTEVIIVTSQGFNATKVFAIHGVTPVEWVNTSQDIVTISGNPWVRAAINPGGNFTYVFKAAGTYSFSLFLNPDIAGQVAVS